MRSVRADTPNDCNVERDVVAKKGRDGCLLELKNAANLSCPGGIHCPGSAMFHIFRSGLH